MAIHSTPPPNPMDLPSSSASHCEHDPPIPQPIQDKIRYAFDHADGNYFKGLIQFWEPVNIDGRCLLTISDQPFILNGHDEGFEKYRLCCVKYKYDIDVNYEVKVEEDPTIITSGAPATAFRNQVLVFVGNLMDHQMTPLVSSALKNCRSFHSIVLPVFYPSLSSCVGVVECSSSLSDGLDLVFDILIIALETAGLKTFDAEERLPYKTIPGLQNAKNEIDDALKIIGETHSLPFSQVWIPCEDEKQVAFSCSLQDSVTKRMLWLKLSDHSCDTNSDDDDFECLQDYVTACNRLPLKMEDGFAGKTLQNYEPHFIRNISKLNDNNNPLRLLFSIDFPCSCLVIYLRSTKTGDLCYVFEFLWIHKRRKNVTFFESLLLTLKRCLPSFNVACGAELGDELRIIDVQASTERKIKYFKIFQTNKLLHESVTPKRGRRAEDEECLKPLKAKCKTTTTIILSQEPIDSQKLNVSLSTLKLSHKSQFDTKEEEDN